MYYEEFFGLKEAPFNVTPDPRFIFFSRKHMDAFSALLYGIESRKGFVQITGEIGAGKTTLCRALLNRLNKGGKTHSALILNPCFSELPLLKTIVEDFGIETRARNKKDCFDALNRYVLDEFHKGFNMILIIDEAQAMSPRTLEQIRLLSNLETNTEKLLQIILVGQPELRSLLARQELEQLRQRISVRFHLTALDRREVEEYIAHRLRIAAGGDDIESPFAGDAVDLLFEQTKGIPRIVNKICDRALLSAYAKDQRRINREMMEEAVFETEGVCVS